MRPRRRRSRRRVPYRHDDFGAEPAGANRQREGGGWDGHGIHRQAAHSRGRAELGRVARFGRLGALPQCLAPGRPNDGDVVSGSGGAFHRSEPRRLEQGRQHPSFSRRVSHRRRRRSSRCANQDEHFAARHCRRRGLRHCLHRSLLRFLRKT